MAGVLMDFGFRESVGLQPHESDPPLEKGFSPGAKPWTQRHASAGQVSVLEKAWGFSPTNQIRFEKRALALAPALDAASGFSLADFAFGESVGL
jgi:hypothetical protein